MVCPPADLQITSKIDAIKPGIQLTSSEPIPISFSGSSITSPMQESRSLRGSFSLTLSSKQTSVCDLPISAVRLGITFAVLISITLRIDSKETLPLSETSRAFGFIESFISSSTALRSTGLTQTKTISQADASSLLLTVLAMPFASSSLDSVLFDTKRSFLSMFPASENFQSSILPILP